MQSHYSYAISHAIEDSAFKFAALKLEQEMALLSEILELGRSLARNNRISVFINPGDHHKYEYILRIYIARYPDSLLLENERLYDTTSIENHIKELDANLQKLMKHYFEEKIKKAPAYEAKAENPPVKNASHAAKDSSSSTVSSVPSSMFSHTSHVLRVGPHAPQPVGIKY
jgi:hypothetical protein